MLISILILESEENKRMYNGKQNKNISFRMQTRFLDPSDEHNLPKSLMLKGNFIALGLTCTD